MISLPHPKKELPCEVKPIVLSRLIPSAVLAVMQQVSSHNILRLPTLMGEIPGDFGGST